MALNKTLGAESDVINLFEAEGARKVIMGMKPEKAAQILNRLIDAYTKPKEATVREVVSNATDATVLVPLALRRPIEITSPSTFKPALTVRDYGVGMTPEIVDEVFLQFGGSTKEDDFSQIGAFGLGAKAPLSYCSEFSVSTTRDGITTDVLVSRTVEGPGAKILSVRKTDEPNGTVVTIPVRMDDRSDFVAALEPYRKYSFDAQISIDGEISSNTENFIDFDKIVLDEESNTLGRVWVNKNSLTRLFKNSFDRNRYGGYRDGITMRYSLSGWIYSDPDGGQDSYYRRNETDYDVVVELKPGIVDFSTSRDEITKNDRSKALSEVSTSSIVKNPEYLFKNVMKEYSKLTDKQAYAFAADLVDLIDPVKTDDKTIHLGRDTIKMSFGIEEFNTPTGFNPFKVILNRHEKNILSIVGYDTGAYSVFQDGLPSARPELLTTRPELVMFYRSESYSNGGDRRVGTLNSHIFDLAEAGERKESLVDYIAESTRTMRSANRSYKVVTLVDGEKMKKINARRKVLSDNLFRGAIVFYTNLSKISQDQIDLAEKLADREIEFITADEVIEKANELRKEIAKANPKSSADELLTFAKVDTEGATTQSEVIKKIGVYGNGTSTQITLDEIMDSDALLVVGNSRNHRATLIGAANSGIKITGRDIYLMDYGTHLRATHFTKMKNYDGVIVNKGWTYTSAAFNSIAAVRSFHEVSLNEEVKSMPDEKIVSMYLLSQSRNCGDSFLKFLKSSTTADEDHEIFNLIVAGSKIDEYPAFSPEFILKNLATRIGEEKARKIRAFAEVSNRFRSGSFSDLAVQSMMRFSGSISEDDSLAIQVRDVFLDRYRARAEQILADEVAALKAAAEIVDAVDLTDATV